MTEFFSQLDGESRRIHVSGEAIERVRERAHRNQRNHKVVAGVVSVAIAATSIGLAYGAFRPDPEIRPAPPVPDEDRMPIWPIRSAAGIDSIQRQVNSGYQPWYLSPKMVARDFAIEVMGWKAGETEMYVHPTKKLPGQTEGEEQAVVSVSNPGLSETIGAPGALKTQLTMQRWRGAANGVWVITQAYSESLTVERPAPYEDFGSRLTIEGKLSFVPRTGVLQVQASPQGLTGKDTDRQASEEFTIQYPSDWINESDPILSVQLLHDPHYRPGSIWSERREMLTLTAYRLGQYVPEGGSQPIPGPSSTPSPTPSPEPLRITVIPGSQRTAGESFMPHAVALILRSKGYEAYESVGDSIETVSQSYTEIYVEPRHLEEAQALRDGTFPDTRIEIARGLAGEVVVAIGDDFAEANQNIVGLYEFLFQYSMARTEGSGAERFLSERAATQYKKQRGGLDLYGYFGAGGWPKTLEGVNPTTHLVSFEFSRDGRTIAVEHLVVVGGEQAQGDPNDWLIVDARRWL